MACSLELTRTALIALVLASVGACVAPPPGPREPATWGDCDFPDLHLRADFPAARANACRRPDRDHLEVMIEPEGRPINPSPWYAFRVDAARRRTITLTLHYSGYKYRYPPKLSSDGTHWRNLPESDLQVADDQLSASVRLKVTSSPLWVAAQELFTNSDYDEWTSKLLTHAPFAAKTLLGKSREGRDIWLLNSSPDEEKPRTLVIVGRQHPPEVTGAFALTAFVEQLLADTPQARNFREGHRLLIVPNLNPDGVAHGNWRHNAGGIDLNRDWGPFTQPETRLMRDLIASTVADRRTRLQLVLDFHSTYRDLMYTQYDEEPVEPPMFAAHWIARIRERLPAYALEREPNNSGVPSARTYVSRKYGISSITYEVGDNTERARIARVSQEAAFALMDAMSAGDRLENR